MRRSGHVALLADNILRIAWRRSPRHRRVLRRLVLDVFVPPMWQGQGRPTGQPPQTDRPLQAPRVSLAFSFAVPAAVSNASSETSKARISSSVFSSPIVVFFMAKLLRSPAAPAVEKIDKTPLPQRHKPMIQCVLAKVNWDKPTVTRIYDKPMADFLIKFVFSSQNFRSQTLFRYPPYPQILVYSPPDASST